jgi:hypothetical protein
MIFLMHIKEKYMKINRACCFTSLKGSITLETSLVLPLFLFAMISGMLYGETILIKGQIYHGLLETAKILASESYYYKQHDKNISTAYAKILLIKYADIDSIPATMKISSISLSNSKLLNEQEEVELHLKYNIQISFPLFGTKKMKVKEDVWEKAFTGYRPTEFEQGEGCVYVTKYGTVYHTSIECSHIMLKISDSSQVRNYINGKTSYKPCSKCAKNLTGKETQLFIPKEGDCYHISLNCSGLTRTIEKVAIKEVEGMKPCSKCGK